jgi:hypothetical protein
MKKMMLCVSVLLLAALSACTSKNDRLSADTLTISIDPSTPQSVAVGGTLSLKAICKSAKTDNVDISPAWSAENSMGTFSPASGKSTTFTAVTASTGSIYATYSGVRGSVLVTVTSASSGGGGGGSSVSYTIYDDSFASDLDAPGAFNGGSDSIVLSADTSAKSQGTQSFLSTFTVTSSGWAGWYVSASTTKGMSAYSSGHLQFDIRSAYDIQVGIRSNNINSGTNSAKKYISAYITPDGTQFKSVSIPIADLVNAQAGTDLSQMKDMFIATAVGTQTGAQTSKNFWIDNIRWTSN